MPRLLFEKTGNAIWISHLDLMRLFQRSFKRAGLALKHTQGFNPRPSVSIALPLSVGVESKCELLDFEIDGIEISCEEILLRLNPALIEGVRVLEIYNGGSKIRDLAFLRCCINLEYDNGVPQNCVQAIKDLFTQKSLLVPKKSKNGVQNQDIIPMIRSIDVNLAGEKCLEIDVLISCQNPALNPMQLPLAISTYLPDFAPDFSKCCRLEIYDKQENIFR